MSLMATILDGKGGVVVPKVTQSENFVSGPRYLCF